MRKQLAIFGGIYDFKLLDSTHIALKDARDDRWGIPLHHAQLSEQVLSQLKTMGCADSTHFINLTDEEKGS